MTLNALAAAECVGLTSTDRLFLNTPPYFTSGICHFLATICSSSSLVSQQGFLFGADFLEALTREKCTGIGGAPANFVRLIGSDPSAIPQELRFFISSGDHLPTDLILRARARFPRVSIFTMYGLTEVSGRLCVLKPEALETHAGSVGQPLGSMKIRIVDQDRNVCRQNELGEVIVDGPMLMFGYLKDVDKAPPFEPICEFATGDFGHIDGSGQLWLSGRRDDVFKCGGEKVSTIQIQNAILATGLCLDVAVLAVDDSLLGKVAHAFVMPIAGQKFERRTLVRQLKTKLPPTHMPAQYREVPKVPRTGSGKIAREELMEMVDALQSS